MVEGAARSVRVATVALGLSARDADVRRYRSVAPFPRMRAHSRAPILRLRQRPPKRLRFAEIHALVAVRVTANSDSYRKPRNMRRIFFDKNGKRGSVAAEASSADIKRIELI